MFPNWDDMSSDFILFTHGVLPSVPTRAQVLSYNTHFMGGLLVNSQKYGLMPWWDAALSWCDYATRQEAYRIKRLAGDTHCIVELPNGYPLYDEPEQFYSPDRFGPLDWTNGESSLTPDFINLIKEVIVNGFKFHIAMDERYDHSIKLIPLVANALASSGLTKYGCVMPGYDGVFYGWDPSQIVQWGSIARTINSDIYLGLEFNVGHIPLGEGGRDYQSGGRMENFDIIFGEFNSFVPNNGSAGDSFWQIVGRMVRPYNRPPDQPSWDDPSPPFYLVDSPRGQRYFVFFETGSPYDWVRCDPNNCNDLINSINSMRNYAAEAGCYFLG